MGTYEKENIKQIWVTLNSLFIFPNLKHFVQRHHPKLAESNLSIFLVRNLNWDSYSFKCGSNGMIYVALKMSWATKLAKFLH